MSIKNQILIAVILTSFLACRKEPATPIPHEPDPQDTTSVDSSMASLRINIQNVVDSLPLILNSNNWYINSSNDSFSISTYKYYLSNIELIREDNSIFKEPESYRLIDADDASSGNFRIDSIPVGTYRSIRFLIGVDPERNTSGAQTGALDPKHGMFWDWNTGYIMAKMEGTSPSAPFGGTFGYHLGGFQNKDNVLQLITLDFNMPLEVQFGQTRLIQMKADAAEWFRTPTPVSIKDVYVIGSVGPEANQMAENYADMFTIERID